MSTKSRARPAVRLFSTTCGVLVVVLVAVGCSHASNDQPTARTAPPSTNATTSGPCGQARQPRATYEHVIWVWMENHRREQVLGSAAAPYTSALARACGSASDYHAVGSPSLPNYIAATSGTTAGIADDDAPPSHPVTADNVFRQVRAAGGQSITYAESMPSPCMLRGVGRYAVKHNPAAYFVGGDDRAACRADNRPVASAAALATILTTQPLPTFTFVVPNLCDDTHDCPVRDGDRWLASWLPRVLAGDGYTSGTTAVFIVWDEPTPMPFVAIAPTIPRGTTVTGTVDHYALLRTTEELLGLSPHLGNAASAPSMRARLHI